MTKGITLIELLLVVALVALLAASTTPLLSRLVLQVNFNNTQNQLISSLHKAQEYSLDGKQNSTWGVCLISGSIRLYQGNCNTPTYQENYPIPSSVTVSNLNNLSFNQRGEPNSAQSIGLNSAIDSATIVINPAGGIDPN